MKIAIIDSDTKEIIYVPALNQRLERDLHEIIDAKAAVLPRWKRKKHHHLAKDLIAEVAAELRDLTRF